MVFISLIMALSQSIRLILFLYHWQILMQTINLLWIYDPLCFPYLLMISPQEDEQEDDLGAEQGATHKP